MSSTEIQDNIEFHLNTVKEEILCPQDLLDFNICKATKYTKCGGLGKKLFDCLDTFQKLDLQCNNHFLTAKNCLKNPKSPKSSINPCEAEIIKYSQCLQSNKKNILY
ncbi:hypothetical protein SteCoe_17730 [Stentor coeruleus]|uniref:IMS import disulfide relay-system CHCH-CHCH-like Cx9C domain-containing protein n=1 Tax=Stentor coeruleus TaxID=5963 RepID=A0A1R2BYB6_9CILI|nr:hypothetical protein SteCoe_17730 [Stentor coeruleus]